jgi:hypothetical protein
LVVVSALVLSVVAATADDRPVLTGTWRLQPQGSDDIEARITAWAGPGTTVGHGDWISVGDRSTKEVDRIELRQLLLDRVQTLNDVEIKQDASEFTIVDGEIGVRIFYFDREHVRQTAEGVKLTCRTRWDGDKLVVDEKGDKVRIVEVFTLVPGGSRLTRAVHLEHDLRKEPLDLRLLYERVQPGAGQ